MPRPPEPPTSRSLRPPATPSSGGRSGGKRLTLGPDDFDAPRSRAARADLRRRMGSWAGGVVERLRGQGLDVVARLPGDGDDRRVLFVREREAGEAAPTLGLGVEARRLRAGLELPAGHARAARARVADPERALKLATALSALPEQVMLGIGGRGGAAQAPLCTVDDLRAVLDAAEREQAPLWIGWSVPRDVALEHAALLDEQLEDVIAALVDVFMLLAGEPDAGAARPGRQTPRRRGRGAAAPSAEDERERRMDTPRAARAGREAARERGGRDRVRARDREREVERDADGEGGGEGEPARDAQPARPGAHQGPWSGGAKASRSAPRPRSAGALAPPPIERGARVSVLRGPFEGKVGVVQELDGKGGARVMLGLLAVRLDVTSLAAAVQGRGRPRLSTSHRKPLLARSARS